MRLLKKSLGVLCLAGPFTAFCLATGVPRVGWAWAIASLFITAVLVGIIVALTYAGIVLLEDDDKN